MQVDNLSKYMAMCADMSRIISLDKVHARSDHLLVKYNADIDRFIKIKLEVPPYLYFYFTLKLIAKRNYVF